MPKWNKIRSLIKEKWISLRNQGAAHIFIGSFITKFVAFFASIFIVKLFSKADYGVLGYVENKFGYIYLIAGLGLTNAILRFVIINEEDRKYDVYHFIIRRSTIYNVVIVALSCAIFYWLYPFADDFQQARYLLPLLILSLPFHSVADSGTLMLRAMFDNKRYAVVSCLLGVCVLVFKYLFARIWGLTGAMVANVTAYGLWAAYLLWSIRRLYFAGKRPSPLPYQERREIDIYSLQYMITNGLWTVFMLNDIYLLGKLTMDSVLVADYKVAYALPGNISLFSAAIGVFVAPLFIKHEREGRWIRKNYPLVLAATGVMVCGVAAVLFIWARPVITLIYGERYATVVPVMRVLLIASVINNVFRYTNANLLAAMGQIKVNLVVSVLGVLAQVGINMVVIPRYGAMGLAWTSTVVYTMMAAATGVAFARRFLRGNGADET